MSVSGGVVKGRDGTGCEVGDEAVTWWHTASHQGQRDLVNQIIEIEPGLADALPGCHAVLL